MSSLVTLSLDNLPLLRHIGWHALSGLPALQTLKLCNDTLLSDIDDEALSHFDAHANRTVWPALIDLDLSHNNLSDIRIGLLGAEQWVDIESVQLEGNPWRCSCTPRWLQTDLMPVIRLKTDQAM